MSTGLLALLCASCAPHRTERAPAVVVRRAPQHGRVLVSAPEPAHATRSRRPTAATNTHPAALTAETLAARHNPQRSGSATPFNAESIRPVAFRTSDGTSGWKVTIPGGRPLATPALANGIVYVGGGFGSHEFYALDARTGVSRWALQVSDDGPTAAVVDDGVVAFNTESCTLFVVDEHTGHPLWSRWLGDPLMSQPAILDGRLFMVFPANGGHRLVAFSLRSGEEQWRVAVSGDVISAPVAYGDSVFAAAFDGTVYRFRANDGALAWQEAFHATSAPWLYGDQVFVSHREEGAHASLSVGARMYFGQSAAPSGDPTPTESVGRMSGATGVQTQSGGGWGSRAAPWLDRNVQRRSNYHTSQSSSDTSVGFATAPATAGTSAAEANIGQGTVQGMWEFQGSRPAVIGGRLFLTQGDRLVAMDPDSGHTLWSLPLRGALATEGGHLGSPPAAAGGNLYLATVAGDIVVVSQATGQIVRSIHVGIPMRFQPSIVDGHVFVGTTHGDVIGLDLGDGHADGWSMWGGSAAHNGPPESATDEN